MASPQKAKGTAFEAKIAKYLTQELGMEFKRMPLSGSISYLKGDLWTPTDTAGFEFCIECKHYKEVNWNGLLTAEKCDLLEFWRQALREAEVMEKSPMLIYRWNRSKDFACWEADFINCKHQMEMNVFGLNFKMALLSDWVEEYKKYKTK